MVRYADTPKLNAAIAFAVDHFEVKRQYEVMIGRCGRQELVVIDPRRMTDQDSVFVRPELRVSFPAGQSTPGDERGVAGRLDNRRYPQKVTHPVDHNRGRVCSAEASRASRLTRIAAVGLAAAGDKRQQSLDVRPLMEHVKRSHDSIRGSQVRRTRVLGPTPFGSLAGFECGNDGVALVELQAHPQDSRAGTAGCIRLVGALAPCAVRLAHALEHLVPPGEFRRRSTNSLQAGDCHPHFLEALRVLAKIVGRCLDQFGVGES